ncbi:MAG: hypothetical protein JW900_03555 [Anaerolineae bacterium]|nr:hypothetical protein [Anaerolineae bacterium]
MRQIPIYSTDGDWTALLVGSYLYNIRGEWIGWVEEGEVYTQDGQYAGYISRDQRVLRKRIQPQRPLRSPPSPLPPLKVKVPARVPLAPLFAEIEWSVIDVFEEEPEIFEFVSELRPDMEG